MTSKLKPLNLILATCVCFCLSLASHAEFQSERPMYVQKYDNLNLEIWTELEPLWTSSIRYRGSKPVLLINTPEDVYPPMSMSITSFPGMSFSGSEFDQAYKSFLETIFQTYQLDTSLLSSLPVLDTEYGDLKGREIEFQASVHGRPSDIKVFLGYGESKGPVLLHVVTLRGKMAHLDGQLTRSWSNIRYLK